MPPETEGVLDLETMDEEQDRAAADGAGRAPAPGALETVRAFVNTVDLESGSDELASPEALVAWLAERGLVDPSASVTAAELGQAIRVREALRALLLANDGLAVDEEAVRVLNSAAEGAELILRFDGDGTLLVPQAPGLAGALGWLLVVVHTATIDGTWRRLKVCRSDTCRWAFYDHSKNRSSKWCNMAVCGNRLKARSYRQRHGAEPAPQRRLGQREAPPPSPAGN